MPRTKVAARPAPARRVRLLIATRKGLWTLTSDVARNGWKLAGPQFLGHIVHHAVCDPRDGKTLLAAARTGHLGPTVFRSLDSGQDLEGGDAPAGVRRRQRPRRRSHVLADARAMRASRASGTPARRRRACSAPRTPARPGKASRASTQHPQRKALVRRRPGRHARRAQAALDPDRPARPRSICTSACRAAACSNRWMRAPTGGRSTRACARISSPGRRPRIRPRSALRPLRGRESRPALSAEPLRHLPASTGPSERWQDIGDTMPKSVGYVGFPMVVHPRDPDTLWVFPMDGTQRLAAHGARRAARGLSFARRRAHVEAAGPGIAQGAGMVDGQAPGDDAPTRAIRWDSTSGRRRGDLGQPRRRPELPLPRTAPAADSCDRGVVLTHTSPASARSDSEHSLPARCSGASGTR